MQIIHSFWTRPFLQSDDSILESRFNLGWLHRKYAYFSWALSCLQLKKFYPDLKLVTDDLGRNLLIDKIMLPYDDVSTELEEIGDVDPGMWTMGKVYTYSKQTQPFLHIDGDAFIFRKFDDDLLQANLTSQNKELPDLIYRGMLDLIIGTFDYVPAFLQKAESTERVSSCNAGILGGKNTGFFRKYTDVIYTFLDRNAEVIRQQIDYRNMTTFNILVEQVFFSEVANQLNEEVTYMFPGNYSPNDLAYFYALEKNHGYSHFIGPEKRNRMPYLMMEMELRSTYPEYYDRIINLINTNEI